MVSSEEGVPEKNCGKLGTYNFGMVEGELLCSNNEFFLLKKS